MTLHQNLLGDLLKPWLPGFVPRGFDSVGLDGGLQDVHFFWVRPLLLGWGPRSEDLHPHQLLLTSGPVPQPLLLSRMPLLTVLYPPKFYPQGPAQTPPPPCCCPPLMPKGRNIPASALFQHCAPLRGHLLSSFPDSYSKSSTYERVPFRECIHKSNLFAKSNRVSLDTQLTQSAI